ncbi:MAG: recombination mediator RecR, partial [Campylobacterota bacterium]|nr:recombination mediator RecR [Campylobacterota bacterium]
ICQDISREHKTICVIAKQQDLMIMENLHEYKGLYHVLQGVLNPVEGISADKLTIKNLILRIRQNNIEEVILALDANIHGESTILYLQKLLKQEKVKVSRLARGIPIGGTLEYADEATLSNALKGRKEV